jgi:uncharacterized protein (DUF433 family)
MKLPAFLTEDDLGEIRLTGSRIGLYLVIHYFNAGYSLERLQEEFPSLPPGLLRQVLDFYRDNRAEVDAYVARCTAEMEQRRRGGGALDREELRRRARAQGIDVEELERRMAEACRTEKR